MPAGRRGAARTEAALFAALILSCVACTSLRVPVGPPSFKADQFTRMVRDGVTLEAHPISSMEEYWELFDENLPELGLVALWVAVRNGQQSALSLEKARWLLRTGVRESRSIRADEVLKQYYRRRGIRVLTVNTDRRARSSLETLMLGPAHVAASGMSEGFVFFRTAPSPSAEWMKGSRLVVQGIRTAERESIEFDMPLAYATP